ncbi:hypothetical protein RCL_jg9637.t1 [Rhizophagus clarus]|uniref:Uncharacterized protein n=1 Tax=Rhizophagus clarus TaxID=94130 RepID=A0A8H3LYC9_9GLOM|nr:hypothetical protein RCL_jg9637.t1 [Rhizophagus clarus]
MNDSFFCILEDKFNDKKTILFRCEVYIKSRITNECFGLLILLGRGVKFVQSEVYVDTDNNAILGDLLHVISHLYGPPAALFVMN